MNIPGVISVSFLCLGLVNWGQCVCLELGLEQCVCLELGLEQCVCLELGLEQCVCVCVLS